MHINISIKRMNKLINLNKNKNHLQLRKFLMKLSNKDVKDYTRVKKYHRIKMSLGQFYLKLYHLYSIIML